jgi:hypothetical protein
MIPVEKNILLPVLRLLWELETGHGSQVLINCTLTTTFFARCQIQIHNSAQGCQMLHFQTKVQIWANFGGALDWKMLLYFMPILEYFVDI